MLVDTEKTCVSNILFLYNKTGGGSMSRHKGGENKHWTQKEKLRMVKKVVDDHRGQREVAKEEGIAPGMLYTWLKKYRDFGADGLINKRKPGNPFVKYQNKKNLTREEELEYENMKLKLENELLKKGLTLEEVITRLKK